MGINKKIESILRPLFDKTDFMDFQVHSNRAEKKILDLLQQNNERLLAELDMIYQNVNEDCDYFIDGENADTFRKLLELMIKGKLWQTSKDDDTLCEFTEEGMAIIKGERGE